MLSIVVPVYNVEAYLKQCVDSILCQTCQDFEVILVDDGATDGCPAICDAYAQQDSRVRVVHKKNGGLMSAWKAGLAEARGEYIGFVDSDDWVDADMFEIMRKVMLDSDTDMVTAALVREYDDRSEREAIFLKEDLYDRQRIEAEIFPRLLNMGTMMDRLISPNRVTKLFKAELLRKNLSFCDDAISVGEDFVATFACLCDAQRIYVMDSFFPYHYRIHGTSIMGSYNLRFYDQSVLLNDTLRSIADAKQVYDFSQQLDNDLVSLAYYGIERNLGCKDVSKKEMIPFIRGILADRRFTDALNAETLSKNNRKCLMYKIIIRSFGASALYTFIRRIVLFKRRHFGY